MHIYSEIINAMIFLFLKIKSGKFLFNNTGKRQKKMLKFGTLFLQKETSCSPWSFCETDYSRTTDAATNSADSFSHNFPDRNLLGQC
jgi:hypothetical protein